MCELPMYPLSDLPVFDMISSYFITSSRYAVADGMAAASSSVNAVDLVISVGDNFYLRGVMDEFDLNWRYMLLGFPT